MQYHAFLSHSGQDSETAIDIADQLRRAHQIYSWAYESNTNPGDYHQLQAEVIRETTFVLLVSENTTDESFKEILEEINTALNFDRTVIPVFVNQELSRDSDLKAKLRISSLNSVVLREGHVTPTKIDQLAHMIRSSMGLSHSASNDVFGRGETVLELVKMIESGRRRYHYIYGPPGAGKSTVATEICTNLRSKGWEVGIVNLDRSDTTLVHVATRIQGDIQLDVNAGASKEEIRTVLRHRIKTAQPYLLYLDNFEQVDAEDEREFLEWCNEIPEIRILITSRVFRDPIEGLSSHRIAPLDTPARDALPRMSYEELHKHASVQLFLDRVQDFHQVPPLAEVQSILDRDVNLVRRCAQLCILLDGFPGPIHHVAKNFARRGNIDRLLKNASDFRSKLDAQRSSGDSMPIAVRSIVDLLEPDDARAFLIVSMFSGGFDDEAADAVLASIGSTDEILERLYASSLLNADDAGRWSMYLPIVEAAESILLERNDQSELREIFDAAHQNEFDKRARDVVDVYNDEPADGSHHRARRMVHRDQGNFLMALERAISLERADEAFTLFRALEPVYATYGPASVLLKLAERVASVCTDPIHAAWALRSASIGARSLGQYRDAFDYAVSAEDITPNDDPALKLAALAELQVAASHVGEGAVNRRAYEEAVQLAQDVDKTLSPQEACKLYVSLAYSAELIGGFEPANGFVQRARSIAAAGGVDVVEAWRAQACYGMLLWRDAQLDESIDIHTQSLEFAKDTNQQAHILGGSLTNRGLAELDNGDFDEAFADLHSAYPLMKANPGWGHVNRVALAAATLYQHGIEPGPKRDSAAQDAIRIIDRHLDGVLKGEYGQTIALFLQVKGEAQYWLGQTDDAESSLRLGRAWSRTRANTRAFERDFRICVLLGKIAMDRRDDDEAKLFFDDAMEFIRIRELSSRDWPVVRTRQMYYDLLQMRKSLGLVAN